MQQKVVIDGRERTFEVVGGGHGHRSRALVLVLHGSRQTGEAHRAFTGGVLDDLTRDGRVIVAYLDGYRGNWNDLRRQSFFPARRQEVDDVAFVRAVVERLAVTHEVDPHRSVAVGFSNGGGMVMRLLHEAPGLLAGGAVVAMGLPAPDSMIDKSFPDASPVPLTIVHGTADPIVPYAGGRMTWWVRLIFRIAGSTLSAPATARYFARRNGITAAETTVPLVSEGAEPGISIDLTAHRQSGRPPVLLYTVHGGGHSVPGPTPAPRIVGRTAEAVTIAAIVEDLLHARWDR